MGVCRLEDRSDTPGIRAANTRLRLTDTKTGEDITDNVLSHKGYTFLLISRSLAYADDSNFGDIDQIYEYASEHNIPFYCVTASTDSDINRWRDLTGAEYPFCTADETTLKTIIRSNPGLLLLKDATIIGKWSHNQLPDPDELTASPDKLPIGQQPDDGVTGKLIKVLLTFLLPLTLLTIADRLWAWSKWVRNKEKKESDKIFQIFKNKRK